MDKATQEFDKRELRNFGLVMGVMLIIFFGLLIPWIWEVTYPIWPWILGGIFCSWGLVAPKTLAPVFGMWMKFGHVLGRINTRLIMGLLFYTIIWPIGFAMRLFGWDAMKRQFDASAQSYRVKSSPPPPENLERPF